MTALSMLPLLVVCLFFRRRVLVVLVYLLTTVLTAPCLSSSLTSTTASRPATCTQHACAAHTAAPTATTSTTTTTTTSSSSSLRITGDAAAIVVADDASLSYNATDTDTNSGTGTESDDDGHLIVSLQWPYTTCLTDASASATLSMNCQSPPATFTISSFSYYERPASLASAVTLLTCCTDAAPPFSLSAIVDLAPALHRYWPDFQCDDDQYAWRFHWRRFGSCTRLSQRVYFRRVLHIARQYDFIRALKATGMSMSASRPYAVDHVQSTINAAAGNVNVNLICRTASTTAAEVDDSASAAAVATSTVTSTSTSTELGAGAGISSMRGGDSSSFYRSGTSSSSSRSSSSGSSDRAGGNNAPWIARTDDDIKFSSSLANYSTSTNLTPNAELRQGRRQYEYENDSKKENDVLMLAGIRLCLHHRTFVPVDCPPIAHTQLPYNQVPCVSAPQLVIPYSSSMSFSPDGSDSFDDANNNSTNNNNNDPSNPYNNSNDNNNFDDNDDDNNDDDNSSSPSSTNTNNDSNNKTNNTHRHHHHPHGISPGSDSGDLTPGSGGSSSGSGGSSAQKHQLALLNAALYIVASFAILTTLTFCSFYQFRNVMMPPRHYYNPIHTSANTNP